MPRSSQVRPAIALGCIVALVLLGSPCTWASQILIAQEIRDLSPGEQIRYRMKSDVPRDGAFTRAAFSGFDDDQLVVKDREARIPLDEIGRLQVARGTRDIRWPGLFIGGAAGCGAGILVADTDGVEDPELQRVIGCGIGAGIGMLGGYLVGATIKEPRWLDVDVGMLGPARLGLAVRLDL